MVKLLIPLVVVAVIMVGFFAYMKLGAGSVNPLINKSPTTNTAEQKVPITGNPDDVAASVEKAAADEQTAVDAEVNDGVSVTSEDAELNSIHESVNENEF